MLEELKNDEKLYRDYLSLFLARSACASVSVESENANAYVYEAGTSTYGYMSCFNYLMELGEEENKRNAFSKPFKFSFNQVDDDKEKLYIKFIYSKMGELISKLTNGEYANFRTGEAIVMGSNVNRTTPVNINNELMQLLDDYENNTWDDPFTKEAKFHIRFLHIHPFGDGNGRMGRILTSFNFLRQNIAPPVLSIADKRKYCDYIENGDYQGLAKMMEKLSKREEVVIQEVLNSKNEKKGKSRL